MVRMTTPNGNTKEWSTPAECAHWLGIKTAQLYPKLKKGEYLGYKFELIKEVK